MDELTRVWVRTGLVIDIVGDVRDMNNHAIKAKKSCMLILGGGLVKHHISNANLMRNGADWSININTAQVRSILPHFDHEVDYLL
jgi:deoxyhypusine synthase